MITRDQFEAHVRAEAERRWPMPDDEPDFTSLDRQGAYIAARMEHEWPLVEALQGTSSAIRDLLHSGMEYPETGERHESDPQAAADAQAQAEAALSPYTTKPIEP